MRPPYLLTAALLVASSASAVPTSPAPPAATASSAVPALQSTPGKIEPQPDEMVGAALFARALEQSDVETRLAGFDAALVELPRPTRFRGALQGYRGGALAELGRVDEARIALEEAHRLAPDDAALSFVLGQFLVAQKDLVGGTTLIIGGIETLPALAASWPPPSYESLIRQLVYARNFALRDRLMLALVKSGYAARHPEFGSNLATSAIRSRLDAGDISGATALLSLVTEPGPAIEMIVSKRYAKLWPAVDAWSGGDLHDMRIATLNSATETFKSDPDPDLSAILTYATALRQTGNSESAVKQLQAVLIDPAKWDEDRAYASRIAIRQSNWQFVDGDRDAALATSARFAAVTPIKRYPQVGNVLVYQATLLALLGRGAEALAILNPLEADAANSANFEGAGAQLWFDMVRACAAQGAEAAAALSRLEKGVAVNPNAYHFALSCRGDTAALAQFIVRELHDPVVADRVATELRTNAVSDEPTYTLSGRTLEAAARDPAVVSALDAVSRPIPLSYVRAANKWRH